MIEAKDLRIGNLIEDSYNNYSTVKEILELEIYDEDGNSHSYEECNPVILTEEDVYRLGFIDNNPDKYPGYYKTEKFFYKLILQTHQHKQVLIKKRA